MKVNRDVLRERAEITFEWESEEMNPAGHFSGEGAAEDIAWIKKELKAGNPWAWFQAHVRAEFNGLRSDVFVGCCSYESEEDFKRPGGLYEDMISEAIEYVADDLEDMVLEHDLWIHDQSLCITCIARGILPP